MAFFSERNIGLALDDLLDKVFKNDHHLRQSQFRKLCLIISELKVLFGQSD